MLNVDTKMKIFGVLKWVVFAGVVLALVPFARDVGPWRWLIFTIGYAFSLVFAKMEGMYYVSGK